MSTALGLAGYQYLLQTFPNSALDTTKDFVAEVHPTGQTISPKATQQCCGLTKHRDPMTQRHLTAHLQLCRLVGATFPF